MKIVILSLVAATLSIYVGYATGSALLAVLVPVLVFAAGGGDDNRPASV